MAVHRIRFPYAFASSDTSVDGANAALELIKYNNWRTVAVLYDVATLVYTEGIGVLLYKIPLGSYYHNDNDDSKCGSTTISLSAQLLTLWSDAW